MRQTHNLKFEKRALLCVFLTLLWVNLASRSATTSTLQAVSQCSKEGAYL